MVLCVKEWTKSTPEQRMVIMAVYYALFAHAALAAAGTRQAVDVMEMGGGAEEGDQVVIEGVPTRPSSASTTGHSNTWEVNAVRHCA